MTVEPSVNNHPKGKGRLQEEVAYHNQTTGKQTLPQGGLNSFSFLKRIYCMRFLHGRGKKRYFLPLPVSMVKAPSDEVEQYHAYPLVYSINEHPSQFYRKAPLGTVCPR